MEPDKNIGFKISNYKLNTEQKLFNAIDYLTQLDAKTILTDKLAYEAIFLWGKFIMFQKVSVALEKKAEKTLADVLFELARLTSKIDFTKFNIDPFDQCKELNENDRRVSLIAFVLYILNISFTQSAQFTINFLTRNGLRAHLKFIKNDELIQRLTNVNIVDFSLTEYNLLDYVVLNINALSKYSSNNLQLWVETNTLNILMNLAKLQASTEFDAFLAVSNIANDKQIESLTEIHAVVTKLCHFLKMCANDFRNDSFYREKRQIVENGEILDVEVYCIHGEGISSSILVILRGLYKLSVNDALKSDIYFKNDIKEDLITVLLMGNEIEKKYTLKILGQLSFNKSIAIDLNNQKQLIDYLKESDNLSTLKQTILWNLKSNESSDVVSGKTPPSNEAHVMISYNTASRDLCLKIKSALEEASFKVWIDVSNIHGSSLDSMAQAVENSKCVLMCVTEKYRQSLNCQAEAQYAFKLKKHIIPVIMEKGYENVKGWLGIIISDKIFINFTKYDHDECMRRLLNEIKSLNSPPSHHGEAGLVQITSTKTTPNGPSRAQLIENWTEDEVKKWFTDCKIHESIMEELFPCTGIILQQLYDMKSTAPEFYYQSMGKNKNVNLRSILQFTHHLNKLFV